MSLYYKQQAGAIIWPIVSAGQKAGAPPKQILKQIDAAKPDWARYESTYKDWLAARREARKALGLLPDSGRPRKVGPLFEGGQ